MAAQPRDTGAAGRLGQAFVWAPLAAVLATAWGFAASRLWSSSTVPDDLQLPHLDQHDYFSARFLERAADYEAFLRIDFVLSAIVLLVVLGLYARHGQRFTRESAAGRVGTGMLLGMLGFAFVWLAELPFGIAGLWWERRHHISKQGYLEVITGSFLGLGSQFIFICVAIGIVMALAGVLRQRWWIVGAPVFVALAFAFAFLQPFLTPGLHPLKNKAIAADARAVAHQEGVPQVPVKVQKVRKETTAPNAEAVGIGSSRRVILWDTLLDGRFTRREVRTIIAHEFGHVKRNHILKGIGWFALAIVPTTFLIALATRRRGGMAVPEAVPVALFVLIAVQVATIPLQTLVSRHVEKEADWIALETTRDPAAASGAFTELGRASLSQPRPPGWAYALFENHPTIMQRIEMTKAWQEREKRR
jgi:Zn-dependent protease with chaperone function